MSTPVYSKLVSNYNMQALQACATSSKNYFKARAKKHCKHVHKYVYTMSDTQQLTSKLINNQLVLKNRFLKPRTNPVVTLLNSSGKEIILKSHYEADPIQYSLGVDVQNGQVSKKIYKSESLWAS